MAKGMKTKMPQSFFLLGFETTTVSVSGSSLSLSGRHHPHSGRPPTPQLDPAITAHKPHRHDRTS